MNLFKLSLTLFILLSAGASSWAQGNTYASDSNVALDGYDVVAYFNQHDAVRGSSQHTVKLDEISYYFTSSENAATFKANPTSFQPAFGGYCAFATAMKGAKVPSDPETFKIRDGKLYLFFNDYYEGTPFNTIVPWNSNEKAMISKADANWKNMSK